MGYILRNEFRDVNFIQFCNGKNEEQSFGKLQRKTMAKNDLGKLFCDLVGVKCVSMEQVLHRLCW